VEELRASVIVPAWNAGAVLGECLDSLERQRLAGGFETIVVDDASTDETPELLRRYAGRIRVITKTENTGFSAINNEAAAQARGRVLLFLNSDTELLSPDVLERLVAAAEEPGVGLAGPLLVNPDGSLQPSCTGHPSVTRALLLATGLWRLVPNGVRARVAPEYWSHDRRLDTDWVTGAAVAVPTELFREVGGFWPAMYAEEEDLAFRLKEHGYRVRFDPSARVMHVGNHSLAKRWSEPERAERVAAANLAFLAAHVSGPRRIAIRAITWAGYAARAISLRLAGRRERADVFRRMARLYAGR
jgi:GT2 family glycosyltransferase